jgi:hypothetical protein
MQVEYYGDEPLPNDPMSGFDDQAFWDSLIWHRANLHVPLHRYLTSLLLSEQGNTQAILDPDQIDPSLSMLPQIEPSFRESTASRSTTDDMSIAPTDLRSRSTSNTHDRIDSSHSEAGLAVLGPTHGLSPVSLQPKTMDDSINRMQNRKSGESNNERHFCTFCIETGKTIYFGTKADWKRHETNFHETGEEYRCNVDGCSEIFYRQGDFLKHLSKQHRDCQCPSEVTTNIQLPPKYAYGCGFCGKAICNKRTSTTIEVDFNGRCDHVAQCVQYGDEWTFTKTILGLLKQPKIHNNWREVRNHWCQRIGIKRTELEWHQKTSWTLRQRLECNDFGPEGLEAFLEEAFKLGLLDQNGRNRFSGSVAHPASIPPSAATQVAMSAFSQDAQFDGTFPPSNPLSAMSQLGHNGFNPMGEASTYSKRYSVAMPDAPMEAPLDVDYSITDTVPAPGYSSPFSANVTPSLVAPSLPPVPPSDNFVQDHTKASPGKRLLRRSKSWLSPKRPQHLNSTAPVNHPDLPPRYQPPNRNGGGGRSARNRAAYNEGGYAG